MGDLKSKWLIVAKGLLFLCLAISATALILLENASVRVAALLVILVWSGCRFYYFLFYVLEKYVDPSLRHVGILALMRALGRKRRGGARA